MMYVQGVENIFDLDFNGHGMTYGDVYLQAEREFSEYNFENSDSALLLQHFKDAEQECGALLNTAQPLPLPDRKSTRLNYSHKCPSRMPSYTRNKKQQ